MLQCGGNGNTLTDASVAGKHRRGNDVQQYCGCDHESALLQCYCITGWQLVPCIVQQHVRYSEFTGCETHRQHASDRNVESQGYNAMRRRHGMFQLSGNREACTNSPVAGEHRCRRELEQRTGCDISNVMLHGNCSTGWKLVPRGME